MAPSVVAGANCDGLTNLDKVSPFGEGVLFRTYPYIFFYDMLGRTRLNGGRICVTILNKNTWVFYIISTHIHGIIWYELYPVLGLLELENLSSYPPRESVRMLLTPCRCAEPSLKTGHDFVLL